MDLRAPFCSAALVGAGALEDSRWPVRRCSREFSAFAGRPFAGGVGAWTDRPLALDSRLGSGARSDLGGGADWGRVWID